MDDRAYNETYVKDGALQGWQRNATETLSRRLEKTYDSHSFQRMGPGMQNTIRPVTPEDLEDDFRMAESISSVQMSPRLQRAGEKPQDRRQGFFSQHSYSSESVETSARSGPPVSYQAHARPRTRTLEESSQRSTYNSVSKSRHRIGSVYSTDSPSVQDVESARPVPDTPNPVGFPSIANTSAIQLPKSSSMRGGRRLVKRTTRPTSPLQAMANVPNVGSLPFPVATRDANKMLMLMRTLGGRMRGEVEYQALDEGLWHAGVCYIDDVKGSLIYEGDDNGPLHITIIPDLRGCRVKPDESSERLVKCLELSHAAHGIEVRILPLVKTEFDLWLAALLCWQQVWSPSPPTSPPNFPSVERRSGTKRRDSNFNQLRESGSSNDATIIKVAKLLLWDSGAPTSPSAIVRRPSTQDLRSSHARSWRRVSCTLQDNGEFKLYTENDVNLLSVIQLSQLSRCAIQRLDYSVLDVEYSIAIFPQYASKSTQLSILRPVYIALESRLTYEVWFCLLRAFPLPEMHRLLNDEEHGKHEDSGVSLENAPRTDDMFRIEKCLNVRVVEAKIRKQVVAPQPDLIQAGRYSLKTDQQDPAIGDYFTEVFLDGEVRARTTTKLETRNPFWREDCEFLDLPAYLPRLSIVLKKFDPGENATHGFSSSPSIHTPDHRQTEVVCGAVSVPLDSLQPSKDSEAWWTILDDNQEPLGEIFLKIRHEELAVLLAKDYQPLSDLLHRFSAGLTVQIAQAIPTSLRSLSEIFINIFQVSGHSTEWLKSLIEDEIDGIGKEAPLQRLPRWSRRAGSNESLSSLDRELSVRDMGKSLQGEANLLFRGNSLLTQALDFHMRRLGKDFLLDVLSEKILEINALNPDCEVDPSRLIHGENVSRNWTRLISSTTSVWENIAASANRCPPELRQILKYIRAVAEDRYGDFFRTVTYTSVSGFLFLRFFCPALLNPKLFGLLRDHPQPKAQRTLTLIAKSLQALANLSTFGQKEEWMEPMNRFLGSHRQAVKDYIDAICSISSDRITSALPASYSTPITILARLPTTSREGFPSLPYLIDQARNFAALVKLWLEASANFRSSLSLEGEMEQFNRLCIDLGRRTDEFLMKVEAERTPNQLSLQLEDIVESLESFAVNEDTNQGLEANNSTWTEHAASISGEPRIAPGSAGSVGSKERKERQSFWEAAFAKDAKYQSPYQYDAADSSPPVGGQSRNGNHTRSFLRGLRRKGKRETTSGSLEKDT